MKLTDLERRFLNVCAGGVEVLPYSDLSLMASVQRGLQSMGYIECGYDDDQPTCWATERGRAALEAENLS